MNSVFATFGTRTINLAYMIYGEFFPATGEFQIDLDRESGDFSTDDPMSVPLKGEEAAKARRYFSTPPDGFVTFGDHTFAVDYIVTVHDRGNGECAIEVDNVHQDYDDRNKVVLAGAEATAAIAYFNNTLGTALPIVVPI